MSKSMALSDPTMSLVDRLVDRHGLCPPDVIELGVVLVHLWSGLDRGAYLAVVNSDGSTDPIVLPSEFAGRLGRRTLNGFERQPGRVTRWLRWLAS